MLESWEFAGRNRLSQAELAVQQKQNRTGYTTHPASAHWFVNDVENPYSEDKPFDWMRGYHVGGRSIMWGRQSYRLSDLDFEANAKEGVAVDWPIRYADIAPWYDYVERFAGISGNRDGLPHLPDGQFLPPMEMNVLERDVRRRIAAKLGGRPMIIGRAANLTQPHLGRGSCQSRNRCSQRLRRSCWWRGPRRSFPTSCSMRRRSAVSGAGLRGLGRAASWAIHWR
jgi:choline dehydrogenase-like flavoprotein